MTQALLVEIYEALPQPRPEDEPDVFAAALQSALEQFRTDVSKRYNEGTLQRVLRSECRVNRKAAAAALGVIGTLTSNALLAARLHDSDAGVRHAAIEALWSIWFRGSSPENVEELNRLATIRDIHEQLTGLDLLVKRAPHYAEAVNQRAIAYYRLGQYQKSVMACERVLKLNPHHFGAQAGLGMSYLKMKKHRASLRAFRAALKMNPNMPEVRQSIRQLEDAIDNGHDERKS